MVSLQYIIHKKDNKMIQKRRHLAKAFTWRICVTCVIILAAILVTGDIKIGLLLGPIDFFVKIMLYFFHERLWLKIKFGIIYK